MELSLASLNPAGGGSLWKDANCGAGTAANKGIQSATANQIAIEMDLNADGAINSPNELIIYTYDSANQQITRRTGCPLVAVQPFLGDVGAPSTTARNVLVINNALGISMFRYFDGNGTEFVPNANTIPNIRKIRVTIAVQAAAPDVQGQSRRLVYSSDIIPRNHVVPASLP